MQSQQRVRQRRESAPKEREESVPNSNHGFGSVDDGLAAAAGEKGGPPVTDRSFGQSVFGIYSAV